MYRTVLHPYLPVCICFLEGGVRLNFASDDLFYVFLIACQLLKHKLSGVVEVLANEISDNDSLLKNWLGKCINPSVSKGAFFIF